MKSHSHCRQPITQNINQSTHQFQWVSQLSDDLLILWFQRVVRYTTTHTWLASVCAKKIENKFSHSIFSLCENIARSVVNAWLGKKLKLHKIQPMAGKFWKICQLFAGLRWNFQIFGGRNWHKCGGVNFYRAASFSGSKLGITAMLSEVLSQMQRIVQVREFLSL